MILPYALRLLALCAAAFFPIHAALAAVARALAPWTVRRAARIAASGSAQPAARMLLALRLFPAALALAAVAGLCLPSFLAFERERGVEAAGLPFLLIAGAGGSVWAIAFARAARALARSRRWARQWRAEDPAPFMGLAGVLRPRVLLSRCIAGALDADQLAAALLHEQAHCSSSDNLKRLMLQLAPDPLPGVALFRAVDRAWARFAEWAADDLAVSRDPDCSVSLAEALVRVARMGAAPPHAPLVSRFVSPGADIPARVERLLRGPLPAGRPSRLPVILAAAALAAPFLTAALLPQSLNSVHEWLERLMH